MTPEELYPRLTEAFNAGNLDAMLACYDAKAVFVIKPGRVTEGSDQLRAALQHGLALRARLTITPDQLVRSDDMMLVLGTFTMEGTRADGSALDRTGRFADVLRRQRDGGWRIAVDNPFGGEPRS
jgi:uncharacterized protein (TIGR02246 family)